MVGPSILVDTMVVSYVLKGDSRAELKVKADQHGLSKQTADLWVAATASRHDLPLLTFDRGFLSGLGIRVIDPIGSKP